MGLGAQGLRGGLGRVPRGASQNGNSRLAHMTPQQNFLEGRKMRLQREILPNIPTMAGQNGV